MLDPRAEALAEDRRFPFCARGALFAEATAAGLRDVIVEGIHVPARCEDFEAL